MLALAALLATAAPEFHCPEAFGSGVPVVLQGRLERVTFTTEGFGPEREYVLLLARPFCGADGREFVDPRRRLYQVQLYTSTDRLRPALRAAVGHHIRIRGVGYGAMTRHDYTNMVVNVNAITMVRR